MCTHNQCFEQKMRKLLKISSENEHFYSREMLLYIAWVCLCNVLYDINGVRLCILFVIIAKSDGFQ